MATLLVNVSDTSQTFENILFYSLFPHTNFGFSTIAVAPSPASSGTQISVQAGDGVHFPSGTFNVAIWPTGTRAIASNAEIATVSGKSDDVFQLVRTQEGSTNRSILTGDQIANVESLKVFSDIENYLNGYKLGWINSSMLVNGLVLARQGGTTGSNSWLTVGTSNTTLANSIINPFIQVGGVQLGNSGVDETVTYPTAYNQVPLVFGYVTSSTNTNEYCNSNAVGTTTFKIRAVTAANGAETAAWMSIGQ